MEDQSQKVNLSVNTRIERDRQMINDARARGGGALFGTFVRLSGPGWLQSAITLGGGTLSNSLYLAVLTGFTFLWLQPLAMAVGIVMLSAISYFTLSTGERPLRVINTHINPVLGWSWLLASMAANLVWSMPQFALGLASDALTSIHLATRAPTLIAPAMNGKMWLHEATQGHVATLKARGVRFVGPDEGMLACGYEGCGRLAPVEAIVEAAQEILGGK